MNMPSKKAIILLSVLGVIILILAFFYISFVSSKTISARLLVEKEKVFVNNQEVSGDLILDEEDTVSTSGTGSATIILYESIVVILESDTTVIVKELSKKNSELSQEKGETWNQFTKLFGVDKYTIRTSTSVASVRGTEFSFAERLIFVSEGEVDYDIDEKSYVVQQGKAVEKIGELVRERDMTPEEQERARIKRLEAIESLKKLRLFEIAKHQKTVNFLKNKYGFTEEDIKTYLEEADRGERDINELKEKSPVQIGSLEKLIDITEKIKELNSSLTR